jgi:GH15 family glucan-1,4-alpha-glucosidase
MTGLLSRIIPRSNANSNVGSSAVARLNGYLPLEDYAALGEGRSVALSGKDGSIDWWCVPNMDSPPLFDRLLDAEDGGYFLLEPDEAYTVTRTYRTHSNVLETTFRTSGGVAMLTESMNSGTAGRLPWAELARRVDGRSGSVRFKFEMKLGRRGNTANPYHSTIGKHVVFHVETVLGLLLHSDGVKCQWQDEGVSGCFAVSAGQRKTFAIVAGRDEPLVVPKIEDVDHRIDISDDEWRTWARSIDYEGPFKTSFVRSALALKLLLYSPSGAIAAAATTSLPERIGGDKNYDYRYAWIRDAGYTIKAFLAAGAEAEAKAAFSWLLSQLKRHGPKVFYTLEATWSTT